MAGLHSLLSFISEFHRSYRSQYHHLIRLQHVISSSMWMHSTYVGYLMAKGSHLCNIVKDLSLLQVCKMDAQENLKTTKMYLDALIGLHTRLFSPASSSKTPEHTEPEPAKTPPDSQEDDFGDRACIKHCWALGFCQNIFFCQIRCHSPIKLICGQLHIIKQCLYSA